jgi:hypothetical protein
VRLPYMLAASALIISGLAVAPTATAECVAYNGTMICSDDGPTATGNSSGSGPVVPYPCDLDWYCDDGTTWDLGLDNNDRPPVDSSNPGLPDIGAPGRPDIGLPGRPGDRPGGGGGGIGSGGGGNRPGGGGGGQ